MQAVTNRLSRRVRLLPWLSEESKAESLPPCTGKVSRAAVARIHPVDLALTKVDLAGADTLHVMGAYMCFLQSFHVRVSAKNHASIFSEWEWIVG